MINAHTVTSQAIKTLVIESGKCVWGKCIFCGYSKPKPVPVNVLRMRVNLDKALAGETIDTLKIFTSGSFFDDKQFPREFRKYVASKCKSKGIKTLITESLPCFITPQALSDFKGIELVIGIGLEVADDKILKKIKKPFAIKDYVAACKIIHECGCKVRTYLMVNLPFTKEPEAIRKSVAFAEKYSDLIIAINTLPHSKAALFDMWIQGKWSPMSKQGFFEAVDGLDIEKDAETFHFIPRFPRAKQKRLIGVGVEFINHAYFNVWQDFVQRFYERPEGRDVALFVPCSYTKPYSRSPTHRKILKVIQDFPCIHLLVVSNPGVIPFEFNNYYPFNDYDWSEDKETAEVMKEYTRITTERVKKYLQNHKYKKYFCYFKPKAESKTAVLNACKQLKIPITDVLRKDLRVQDEEALSVLGKVLLLEEPCKE